MSQQGERRTGPEDDWWGKLYGAWSEDTAPAPTADTLDDRFSSASRAVAAGVQQPRDDAGASPPGRPVPLRAAPKPPDPPAPPPEPHEWTVPAGLPPMPTRPAPARPPAAPPPAVPQATSGPRAPWEPPQGPSGPVSFPGGRRTARESGGEEPPTSTAEETEEAPAPRDARSGEQASALPDADVAMSTHPTAAPSRIAPAEPTPADPVTVRPTAGTLAPLSYVGNGPPTYEPEPTALPEVGPDELGDLVADTELDGARYGACTVRAASARGDSARFRGEPRRDCLLTARFGSGDDALVLVAMATGARATAGAHRAAADACRWIGRAVGHSHARLAGDIRAARRGDLKAGLHRLTDRSLGKLRARAAELGVEPEEYAASLRCLLLPADPECRIRVFFGVGAGGLFRLRDGEWQDIEPQVADTAGEAVVGFGSLPSETPGGDRLTMDLGIATPPSPYEPAPEPPHAPFRFRASVARPGDTLLLCTGGFAEPLRGEPGLAHHLTARWAKGDPPGLAAFLADTQVRVKGYADDRTAAGVWEA